MPRHDAPYWRMDPLALVACKELAPQAREVLEDRVEALKAEGVEVHDRISVVSEVIAAQLNLLADLLRERRTEVDPETAKATSNATFLRMVSEDVIQRSQLRRARGEDSSVFLSGLKVG